MLEKYVGFNHRIFERILVTHMLNTDKDLDWVVDQLCQGNKIKSGAYSLRGANFSTESRSRASPSPGRIRDSVSPSRKTLKS